MYDIKFLFQKYQEPLKKLANNPLGRKFLGIDKEVKDKIVGITDNAYAIKVGRNKYQATFRCYPVFAKRLHYALTSIDIAQDWLTRNKAIYQPLPDYAGLLNYAGLTRDSRFPNIMLASGDPIYSGAGDGMTKKNNPSWATTRANNADGAYPLAPVDYSYINRAPDLTVYYAHRTFTPFDTSIIGYGAEIKSPSSLFIMPYQKDNWSGNIFNVVPTSQASPTTLSVSDHANWSAVRLCNTDIPNSGFTVDSYTEFALNSTGLTYINPTGYTKIAPRVDKDIDNIAPNPNNSGIGWYLSEMTGTDKDPKLVVTYILPSGGAFWMPKGYGM